MRVPHSSDLLRISHWILSSSSFLEVKNSWDFPSDFHEGVDEGILRSKMEELERVLQSTPLRMGRIFERILISLFEAHRSYRVLESGVGIYDGKHQLTELDLLLVTPEGKGLHLEAAVKFYLFLKDGDQVRVVGPNGNDVLEHRMAKFNRQLEFGRRYVAEVYPDIEFDHCIFTRGRIFQPWGENQLAHEWVNSNCESGWWKKGEPFDDFHQMVSRWEWLAWPPEYSTPFHELEEAVHGWREEEGVPHHLIWIPPQDF